MIHRYWHGPDPLTIADAAIAELELDVMDWTDDLLPAEAVAWLDATALQVNEATRLLHRSNFARWWLLRQYGGVWLDHDVVPLINPATLPLPFAAAHGHLPCTCAMGFPLGHPIPRAMLDAIVLEPQPRDRPSHLISGEAALARIITPDVALIPLPWDAAGRPQDHTPWVEHHYATSAN